MKDFFQTNTVKLLKSLGVAAFVVALNLWSGGQMGLLPALFVGYFLGLFYWFTVAMRLRNSMGKTAAGAKREMLWGLLLRLVLVAAVFTAAIKISFYVFLTVAAGFGIFYVLAAVHLTVAAFGMKTFDKTEE